MSHWLLLSIVALIFWGFSGITQKLATTSVPFQACFLWFTVAFLLMSGIIVVAMPLAWELTAPALALAAFGGLLNGGGVLTSFAALERGGKASVVIPLISLYPLVTVAGAWILLGERLTGKQIAGALLAVLAAVLLSQEPKANAEPAGPEIRGDGVPEAAD